MLVKRFLFSAFVFVFLFSVSVSAISEVYRTPGDPSGDWLIVLLRVLFWLVKFLLL
jgi:hypothetical protein